MKITSKPRRSLTLVDNNGNTPVAPSRPRDPGPTVTFGAYLLGHTSSPSGEINARFGVPYDQLPNFFPLLEHPGGVMFKVTVERVATEELPAGGWGNG